MYRRRWNNLVGQGGQSLVEVLVVAAVLALMLTGIMSVVTVSVSNNRKVKTRAVATRLVQEGIEYVRAQRDNLTWVEFAGFFSGCTLDEIRNVCLNDLTASCSWPVVSHCAGYDLGVGNVDYKREAVVTCKPNDVYEVEVTVWWEESGIPESVSSVTRIGNKPN